MHQWAKEVERRCKPGLLKIYLYHGPNRERNPEALAKHDIVFTSYNLVSSDLKSLLKEDKGIDPVKVRWRAIPYYKILSFLYYFPFYIPNKYEMKVCFMAIF